MKRGRDIKVVDTREEAHSREENRMDEEEKDRYLEDRRDMEEMIDRDMMDIVRGIGIRLGYDWIPEADQILEEEMDSGEIDRGHQTGIQISRGALDANVILVSKLERLWSRSWMAKSRR